VTVPVNPPETLTTARLSLRAPRLADAPGLFAAVRESLPELMPYMAWATPDYSLAACEANTRAAIAQFAAREGLRYGFFELATGEFVGNASFHHLDWSVPKGELGYWCRTSRVGEGLVREGVAALAEMAERDLGTRRLEIRCDTRNRRSARVAEACGFELEGTLRNERRDPQGALRDTLLYARVR
jgi:RimJ/RimL family protein N-acetyltransferase